MGKATDAKRPTGMLKGAREFWDTVTDTYELRADELRVLEDACREMDLIQRLERELKGADLIVRGSQGQPVANPMVSELRQHRSTLRQLLGALKLPDESDTAEARSAQMREVARARWQPRSA